MGIGSEKLSLKTLTYKTRDESGNDIIKEIALKDFKVREVNCKCSICHSPLQSGIRVKDIVSADFTDWAYVGEYVCEKCADLFNLHFYNYIVDPDGIHLYNIREIGEQILLPQKPPFLFIITISKKKHLFYKGKWNYSAENFAVNLEAEIIYTSINRMKYLFDFVELLLTLGCSKSMMKQGEVPFKVIQKIGFWILEKLNEEIRSSREIQIPIYCGQKRNLTEEEAICNINLLRMI